VKYPRLRSRSELSQLHDPARVGDGGTTLLKDRVIARNVFTASATALLAALLLGACSPETPTSATAAQPRPVKVLTLSERDFRRESNLTGLVSLYREQSIGFEVSGRVLSVLDLGLQVEGPALDQDGQLVRSGDVIAAIDDTRYRLQVETLQARLESEEQNLGAMDAELERAQKTLERQKRILKQGAGNQQAVDDANSAYLSQAARQRQQQARVRETVEQLNKAKEDLEDTVLRAPFSGRITATHVAQGAVVDAGSPVVTLSLMDPIQVQVAVSADHDRRIQTGDRAFLYPEDPLKLDGSPLELPALVFEKGSVADPDTHTFRIDLMARNQRLRIDAFDPETAGLPLVEEFLPVARRYQGEAGPLYVPVESLYREDGRDYLLRLPGVGFRDDTRRDAVGRHVPERIAVELSDDYLTVAKWNFRSLQQDGGLREGDFVVLGPRAEYLDGLAIGRPQWLLRPGDLVPVRFLLDTTPRGFYVPVDAITLVDGQHAVFVLDTGVARLRPVSVHEIYGELRRIEGEGIANGTEVITGGMQFVSDGEAVRVVEAEGEGA
jgi:RND family efflux transporter MFP subunit